MYQENYKNFIAVLTQERLLRFLIKYPDVKVDYIFVDEAHNMLGKDSRALLLATVIILSKQRNPDTKIKYLTPFLVDQKNLNLRYTEIETTDYKVQESLKTERYHLVDCRDAEPVHLYDQYFDAFIKCDDEVFDDGLQVITKLSAAKNIIFFNLPKKIEQFLRDFLPYNDVVESEKIDKVCASISDFLDSEYLLVEGLRKGILYHHGSVPDIVKLYIERAYTEIPEIRHIVCNSTLLEGVNIPAEKMFILEKRKGSSDLTKSQFRNLVGRVCRFSEIFNGDPNNLSLLEPEIYIVGTHEYLGSSDNIRKFIKKVAQVDLQIKDEVENVLLAERPLDDDETQKKKKEADEFLENIQPGTTKLDVTFASTPVGRSCFLNNISEVDVLRYEFDIEAALDAIAAPLQSSNEVMKVIAEAFIPYLKEASTFGNLRRLQEHSAQTFYAMLIDWKIKGASYSEMIRNFLRYWEKLDDDEVYVGKWGEIKREDSFRHHWVIIGDKTHSEKVNLAIVRIKEEQDFVDNQILKYVELLNDLEKIDGDLYLKIKYGTTHKDKIRLMNLGVNSVLASKLIDGYSEFVNIQADEGVVQLKSSLISRMRENNENEILVFEAGMHLGLAHEF
ncbi:hypothetical protein QT397_00040 (plasmid) [Microbulbifer sp. MKSA007]|nr:hypothetical protein QT397_00040 [Microbulbifer sp. MKSA007]